MCYKIYLINYLNPVNLQSNIRLYIFFSEKIKKKKHREIDLLFYTIILTQSDW